MINKFNLDTLLKLNYPFEIGPYEDEDFKGFYAKYKDLPVEVYSIENNTQLLRDLEDAKEEYFATAIKENITIPLPTINSDDSAIKTRFTMRVGKSLHRKLSDFAEAESLSLNTAAILLLERGLADAEREKLKYSLDAAVKQLENLQKQQQDLFSLDIINYNQSSETKLIFEEKTESYFRSNFN